MLSPRYHGAGASAYRWTLYVPWYMVILLLGLVPLLDVVRVWERRRSRNTADTKTCPGCGYDLRASTGRCPECGAAIPAERAGKGRMVC